MSGLTERLVLKNFQCYEEQEFQFPVGEITAIIGDTDVGKTAVFRGLEWLLENKNSTGDLQFYRRQGTSKIELEYTFSDGITLKRCRGDGENVYSLLSSTGELISSATARGGSIPDEISKRCLTRPQAEIFDDTSLLMCTQRGASFFIDGGKTTAYELLLHLVDISKISDARQVQRKLRDDLVKRRGIVFPTVRDSCCSYSLMLGVDDELDANLAEQSEIRAKLRQIERLELLVKLSDQITSTRCTKVSLESQLDTSRADLLTQRQKLGKCEAAVKRLQDLVRLRANVVAYLERVTSLTSCLSTERDDLVRRRGIVSSIEERQKRLVQLQGTRNQFTRCQELQRQCSDRLVRDREVLVQSGTSLKIFLEEIGVCPTCGQVICNETSSID